MSTVTEAALTAALKAVIDPHTGRDFVSGKQVKNLRIEGGDVSFDVELGYPSKSQQPEFRKALIAAVRSVPGVDNVSVNLTTKIVSHAVQRGVQLLPKVKNVIAVASGMTEGLRLGHSVQAAVITAGLTEMRELGRAMGAHPDTFAGLAGVGDLVVTCLSPHSRNSTFGRNLGTGMSVDEVVAVTRQTAEGVSSCGAILALAESHDIVMPIVANVTAVVQRGRSAAQFGEVLMADLLTRD